ncbi:hypothetical protein [Lyngbya sp. CCY1209]|uniref:hypothetical protein n=1 Tax=Lyngbya sp. CCY1209 TaxID=2886103 RepID=UPI002D2042C1|nr:hypothetical protein [Lyngbya sp. CCY1209]MEB3885588.1 hypothetical protein [Lyngbya sp. CCY1209]
MQLLQKLYGTVKTPTAVFQEVEAGKLQGINVPEINNIEWIDILSVTSVAVI